MRYSIYYIIILICLYIAYCSIEEFPKILHTKNNNNKIHYPAGYVLELSCSDGYIANGNTTLQCQSDGSWDKSLPHCISKCAVCSQ